MNFIKDFKGFISKGNVFDMAVGIIMGSAFTAIVNSLVQDILSPFLGIFTGGINFNDLSVKSVMQNLSTEALLWQLSTSY